MRNARRVIPRLESLEARWVPTSYTVYPTVSSFNQEQQTRLTLGPDGGIWFATSERIVRIAQDGSTEQWGLPQIAPNTIGLVDDLTFGSDGNLWISDFTNRIYSFAPATAALTTYTLQGVDVKREGPRGITSGPDGNIYFTDTNASDYYPAIGEITLPSDHFFSIDLRGKTSTTGVPSPGSITSGTDGNLYFADERTTSGAIDRMTLAGAVTTFPVLGEPLFVTADSRGIWFLSAPSYDEGPGATPNYSLGLLDYSGNVKQYPAPSLTPGGRGIRFDAMTIGADGDIYFPGDDSFDLIRFDPRTSAYTTVPVEPNNGLNAGTLGGGGGIVTAPDGAIWVGGLDEITRVDLNGGTGGGPPVATDHAYTATAGQTLHVPAPGILGGDSDPSARSLSIQAHGSPRFGSLTLNGDGSFDYTPFALFSGTDSFSYTIGDGTGLTASATIFITVQAQPQPRPQPPHVLEIVGSSHSRKGLTSIDVVFDEALDAVSTLAAGGYNYTLLLGVKKRRHVTFSKSVRIRSIEYDANAHTVAINLAKPAKGPVQVTVRKGIAAANGAMSTADFSTIVY